MQKQGSLVLLLELIWWLVTAIVVFAVLYPVSKAMHVWPFRGWNILFVVVLLTLTRYIFLLKHTFLAKQQVLKVVFMLLMFPLTFILILGLNRFMVFIEEYTWDPLTGHLPSGDKKSIESYLWAQMIFFGAGSIISAPVFAVRLFMSVWRTRNRGTV